MALKTKNTSPIMLAAGGTGGHMFPAAELARVLLKRGHEVNLLTDKRGMNYASLFGDIYKRIVTSGSFSRGGFLGKIFALVALAIGAAKARNIFKDKSPKMVVGFGGYPSLPGILAAKTMNIPYCLHEQNLVLGKVNRKVLAGVSKLAISAEGTLLVPASIKSKTVITGNPVRSEISDLGLEPYVLPIMGGDFNILVVGGSQGAKIFGEIMPRALGAISSDLKPQINILQQCRPAEVDKVSIDLREAGIKAKTTEFIDNMTEALKECHLVICRAGAGSVFEVMAARRPSILVPLPTSADNHQMENAKMVISNGGGWLCPEDDEMEVALKELIEALMNNFGDLEKAANSARLASNPDATNKLADVVEQALLEQGEQSP